MLISISIFFTKTQNLEKALSIPKFKLALYQFHLLITNTNRFIQCHLKAVAEKMHNCMAKNKTAEHRGDSLQFDKGFLNVTFEIATD